MFYEELHAGAWQRLDISGEMLTGRAHHVIYFPTAKAWSQMPEWARDRREEIIARIKSEFREPDYEYADDVDVTAVPAGAVVANDVNVTASAGQKGGLLGMLLALLAWTHATSHPQRWWSWYLGALFNSMAVLSFPGFALPAVLLLGVTLAAVASSGRPVRWLVILSATCAGLLTVLPWLGTSWIQSAFAASYDYAYKRETLDWLPRFLGAGLCGLTVPDSELLPGLASSTPPDLWTEVWQVMPGSLATLVLITTWLVSFGISAIWKVNRLAACWMLALLAGATLTGLSAWYFAGRELLYWYAAYLSVLVPVALAAALGCQTGPRRLVAAGLALWFLIGTFPAGQRGRLDLVPPKRFEILCSRFARVFLVSDARGRTLEVSIR